MKQARLAWLCLCSVAAVWLAWRGVPLWTNAGFFACAVAPAIAGMFLRRTASEANASAVESALWIGMATLGVAATGGAQSPLLVLFGVALAIAVIANEHRLMLEAAVFAVGGYVAALVADSAGDWLNLGVQLALASAYGAAGIAMLAVLAAIAVEQRLVRVQEVVVPGAPRDDSRLQEMEAELKSTRAAMADAEKALSARTRFFAQTSHELRTPLNAIIGFADMMRNAVFGPLPDKYQEYAELIREGGQNLEIVVDDVLDLSKIEAGRYEIEPDVLSLTDIAEAAVRFLRDMAERKGVALSIDTDEDVEAFADPKAARQIALNLISNSLKFTPSGGEVRVSAVETPRGAVLAVSDTGTGMSPEELKTLSEAFRQGVAGKREKGTGLGLSVVRAFIELHGGRLEFESAAGGGTTAAAYFPRPRGES